MSKKKPCPSVDRDTCAEKFITPRHQQMSKLERAEDALQSILNTRVLMVVKGNYEPSKYSEIF